MFESIFRLFWLCALLRQWMCYKYYQHFKMWLGNTFVMYHDHKNYRNMSRFITIMKSKSKSKRQPFFILCFLRVLLACTRTEDGKQVTSGDILPSVTLVTLLQTSRSSEAHGTCHTVVCQQGLRRSLDFGAGHPPFRPWVQVLEHFYLPIVSVLERNHVCQL